MNASNVCDGRSANFAEKKENSGTGNADKTSNTAENSCSLGMVTRAAGGGFIIGAAAGLTLELHSGFLTSWKAFPNSMVRGAVAFGSALGIYEATKCKLLQTRVMDDLSSSSIAGSLGTGVGGTLFGAFPWTRPNSMKMYQERFQENASCEKHCLLQNWSELEEQRNRTQQTYLLSVMKNWPS
ncbi:uncharacterized protein LOC131034636 isoform X2 [Cryptomeria japonica]|uniref:uncharacterized protein LOC131034636 isoform X2 n=1 Tax=Cryptomeria japonica TaxID=3369 RepID=UPI0027DA4C42|nr:uncharacterized protein LOC131034636 isoform X2 [Cryptomeria japonica]